MKLADLAASAEKVEEQFLNYQRRYIQDQGRFVAVVKAVRTGITYAHSWKSIKKRAFRSPRLQPINEIFASKNLVTASEYMGYLRRWAEGINVLAGANFIDMGRWTTERAVLPGGEIRIVSSDPNAFRGMEADITLDEFAFHDRQDELYAAAQSRIQWLVDGQVTLISSHSHPETTFARIASGAENASSHFSLHKITLEQAVKEGLAIKVPGPHQSLLKKKKEKEDQWDSPPAA